MDKSKAYGGLATLKKRLSFQTTDSPFSSLEPEAESCSFMRCNKEIHFISRVAERKVWGSCLCFLAPVTALLSMIYLLGSLYAQPEIRERAFTWRVADILQSSNVKNCQNQCRPPGSEPLPEGIIEHRSNLQMRPLWGFPELDLYEQNDWETPKDAALYQQIRTQHRIFQFLNGLNKELDEVIGQILGTSSLPSIREVFSIVKKKASRKSVMLPASPSIEV
ncbi:hypothetical protein GQ457_10G015150 [Hibiscus cannabinus]